ncbi:MAG: DUF4860 domain-containing protein [Oscillospiraceae bacterium]|nr:DUF4860 domain-containing protein [Oscillospiraceae bacterium]
MRKGNFDSGAFGFVLNLALFTVFALCLMLVLLVGAAAFEEISQESQKRFDERTPLLYMANRLSAFEQVQIIDSDAFGGITALKIVDNDNFIDIYIYFCGSYIREYYCLGFDAVPQLEMGMELFPVQSMAFEQAGQSLIRVTINGKEVYANVEVCYE